MLGKKVLGIAIMAIMLNGCTDADGYVYGNPKDDAEAVHIYRLSDGYSITDRNGIRLDFCRDNTYRYSSSESYHVGTYDSGTHLPAKVQLNNGDSVYYLRVGNGYLEIGETYIVTPDNYDFTVKNISASDC